VSSETIRKDMAAQQGVSPVKKAFLYRLYPTEEQAQALQQQLDVGREMLANTSGLGSSPQAPTWPAGACVA
jgi:hypothetical protein